MAKRKPLSTSTLARRRRVVREQRKKKIAQRKRAPKLRLYHALVDSFVQKQKQKGVILTKSEAVRRDDMKQIIKNLKKGYRLKMRGKAAHDPVLVAQGDKLMKEALEQTTRRDGIPEDVAVGESNIDF